MTLFYSYIEKILFQTTVLCLGLQLQCFAKCTVFQNEAIALWLTWDFHSLYDYLKQSLIAPNSCSQNTWPLCMFCNMFSTFASFWIFCQRAEPNGEICLPQAKKCSWDDERVPLKFELCPVNLDCISKHTGTHAYALNNVFVSWYSNVHIQTSELKLTLYSAVILRFIS